MNTLFALGIPYTFKTWVDSLILASIFSTKSIKKGNNGNF